MSIPDSRTQKLYRSGTERPDYCNQQELQCWLTACQSDKSKTFLGQKLNPILSNLIFGAGSTNLPGVRCSGVSGPKSRPLQRIGGKPMISNTSYFKTATPNEFGPWIKERHGATTSRGTQSSGREPCPVAIRVLGICLGKSFFGYYIICPSTTLGFRNIDNFASLIVNRNTFNQAFFSEVRNFVLNSPIGKCNLLFTQKTAIDLFWAKRNPMLRHKTENNISLRDLRHIPFIGYTQLIFTGNPRVIISTIWFFATHRCTCRRKILSDSGGIHVDMRCLPPSSGQDTSAKSCPAGAGAPSRLASHSTMTQSTKSNNDTDQRWPSADDVALIGGDVQEAQ